VIADLIYRPLLRLIGVVATGGAVVVVDGTMIDAMGGGRLVVPFTNGHIDVWFVSPNGDICKVVASVEKNGVAVVALNVGGGSSTLSPGWVFKQNDITDMHIKNTETPAIICKTWRDKQKNR
jgi:hypothetical protein